MERIVTGSYITECPPDGFRARCACGWDGDWQGYDYEAAVIDETCHVVSAHPGWWSQ